MIAYRRGDLDAADKLYRQSVDINEAMGDERGAAQTYHNWSAVANARKDFESAEILLQKSIHIKERHGDEIGVAHSYQELGVVAETRQELDIAQQWFLKSLRIYEKRNEVMSRINCNTIWMQGFPQAFDSRVVGEDVR